MSPTAPKSRWLDWALLRCTRQVRLSGPAPKDEFLTSLNDLAASPFSFSGTSRRKPLRARLQSDGGAVRWRFTEHRAQSLRCLHFTLREQAGSTVLDGEFRCYLTYRVIGLAWLGIGSAFNLLQAIAQMIHHVKPDGLYLAAPFIGVAMLAGYTALGLRVARGRERDIERILSKLLAGPVQAETVKDLILRR